MLLAWGHHWYLREDQAGVASFVTRLRMLDAPAASMKVCVDKA